ncbi:MAG: hypothetical protein QG669_517 [Patescibacteria group bacterium]|nr:hypothetical protein [Patescibacteria group bacterium]
MNFNTLLTKAEIALFKKLSTPAKIQDYLNTLKNNTDKKKILMSPREVIQHKKAHCMEGALLAGSILWYHGHTPYILDLKTTRSKKDSDHVVALFKEHGHWGAISKTSHAVLRFREPIYKTLRELVLSYFHEYFLDDGTKTLRSYSKPFNLKSLGTKWIVSDEDLWEIGATLDECVHYPLIPKQLKKLRKADPIEISAGKLVEN